MTEESARCLRLLRQWGAGRRQDLHQAGVSDATLRRLLRRGEILPVAHGVYATADGSPRHPVRLALGAGAVLTCVSAARIHGLRAPDVLSPAGRPDPALHLTRPRRPVSHPVRVRHHGDTAREAQPGVALLRDAVVHLLRCQPQDVGRLALDEVFHRGLLARGALLEDLAGPRNGVLRTMVMEAEASADSPPETLMRHALRERGWWVEAQALVQGVGFVDFIVENTVVVEVDGFEFHASPQRFKSDRERDLELSSRGFRVVRVAAADVFRRLDEVVEKIARVVHRAGGGR